MHVMIFSVAAVVLVVKNLTSGSEHIHVERMLVLRDVGAPFLARSKVWRGMSGELDNAVAIELVRTFVARRITGGCRDCGHPRIAVVGGHRCGGVVCPLRTPMPMRVQARRYHGATSHWHDAMQ